MSFGNIVLLLIVGIGAYLVAIYNKLVSLRAGMDASWSDIDVQLKRRYDLIPALVDTVKGGIKSMKVTHLSASLKPDSRD